MKVRYFQVLKHDNNSLSVGTKYYYIKDGSLFWVSFEDGLSRTSGTSLKEMNEAIESGQVREILESEMVLL